MKLPSKETVMRCGYASFGAAAAYSWNKAFSVKVEGLGYLPPAALLYAIVFSDNSGSVEKDLGAAGLGYLFTAQVLSIHPRENARRNPSSEDAKLQKIQQMTQTVGAVLEVLGKFKGGSDD